MKQKQAIKSKMGRPFKQEGEKNTKEKIFDAAIDLFSQNGYERTSVREIASAIGLTEGAFYKHYTNKESILDDVFSYAEKLVFTPLPIEQTLGMLQGMSIFRGLLSPLPDIISEEPYVIKIMRIMFHEMNHNEKIRKYYQIEYTEKADAYMFALFEKCIEIGSIRPCNVYSLTKIFNTYRADWAFQNFIIRQDKPLDLDKLRIELNDMITFFEDLFLPIEHKS
jgi:AcrR family transcriptional regulator